MLFTPVEVGPEMSWTLLAGVDHSNDVTSYSGGVDVYAFIATDRSKEPGHFDRASAKGMKHP